MKLDESEKHYSKIKEAENIIFQAQQTASEIKKNTETSIMNAHDVISGANDRIKTACVNFESASDSLKSCAENLLNILAQTANKLN